MDSLTPEGLLIKTVYCFIFSMCITGPINNIPFKTKTKLHGLSPQAHYTDRATATCQRSD
jgi:hypothetical protein